MFNQQGQWIPDAQYWASPEGQAQAQSDQTHSSNIMNDISDGGYIPLDNLYSQNKSKYSGLGGNQLYQQDKGNILNAAHDAARANSPEWQAAVAAYNAGQPVNDYGMQQVIKQMQHEGLGDPGSMNAADGAKAVNSWQAESDAGMSRNKKIFGAGALALGGAAAAGLGSGGAAAGTSTGGGVAAGGNVALPAGGMTATGSLPAASTGYGLGVPTAGGGLTGAAVDIGLPAVGVVNALTKAAGGGSDPTAPSSTPSTGGFDWTNPQSYLDALKSPGGSAIVQGLTSAYSGNQQADAAAAAAAESKCQFDIGQANAAPWLQAGKTALGAQQDLLGLGANGSQGQIDALKSAPGYQFRLDQGQRGMDASAAARGGMGSGKAATAASQYNQNFASNEYGNRFNQLSAVAGTGQTQANNNIQAGAVQSTDQGNATIAAANARASGLQGGANALSGYLNPTKQPKGINPITGQYTY